MRPPLEQLLTPSHLSSPVCQLKREESEAQQTESAAEGRVCGVRKHAHSRHREKTLARHRGSESWRACLGGGFNSPCTSLVSLKTDR